MMIPDPVELKLDMKCLNMKERKKLEYYFIESNWLKNFLLLLSNDDFRKFDTRFRVISI